MKAAQKFALLDIIYWLSAVRASGEALEESELKTAILEHLGNAEELVDKLALGQIK